MLALAQHNAFLNYITITGEPFALPGIRPLPSVTLNLPPENLPTSFPINIIQAKVLKMTIKIGT